MRWGDHYNCLNPFTIRVCIESTPCIQRLTIPDEVLYRPQQLQIIHVFLEDGDIEGHKYFVHNFSPKWLGVLLIGWILWLGISLFSILAACPISCAYLFVVAFTGVWVRSVFGTRARRLVQAEQTHWRRGVVVADHFNDTNWYLFFGNNALVNSLLNKPLLRADYALPSKHTSFMKFILRVLIAAQWGLILAASAMQSWDAIIISCFIIFCASTSTFVFRPHDSAESWLKSNKIGLEKMIVHFSGRRAMLSAMYAIHPNDTFRWVDPILAPSDGRTAWESALVGFVQRGLEPDVHANAIREGTQKASDVNTWLRRSEEVHRLPPRDPTQHPFLWETQHTRLPTNTASPKS
jgi:hypothetical protein